MRDQDFDHDDNLVARCPACKGIVFISTFRRIDAEIFRKDLIELIKCGFSIEHMTTNKFRQDKFGHSKNCPLKQ